MSKERKPRRTSEVVFHLAGVEVKGTGATRDEALRAVLAACKEVEGEK